MKRILITGANGFIGRFFADYFHSLGYTLFGLEHPSCSTIVDQSKLKYFFADITNSDELLSLDLPEIDTIFHLAGQSSGPKSYLIPDIDLSLNALGTLNVIKLAKRFNIKRLLFASSFVVYGNSHLSLLSEDTPANPSSVYASSKLYAENLLRTYAEPHGIAWNALRMFNVYGPGQDITKPDQGIVGIFLNQLLNSTTVDVKGSVSRFRDLVFIEDVAYAWKCVLESDSINMPFNVGSGVKTSILSLISTLAAHLSMEDKLIINEIDPTPGDINGAYADLSLISSHTGYTPLNDLNSGLRKMIVNYI